MPIIFAFRGTRRTAPRWAALDVRGVYESCAWCVKQALPFDREIRLCAKVVEFAFDNHTSRTPAFLRNAL
jgi:hypothetical protein